MWDWKKEKNYVRAKVLVDLVNGTKALDGGSGGFENGSGGFLRFSRDFWVN